MNKKELSIQDIIVLDNNISYILVYILNENTKKYGYLMNIENNFDIIICEILENNKIEEINDNRKLYEIITKMSNEITMFFE